MLAEEDCSDQNLEDLQFEYDAKCDEVVELRNELRAAQLEVQQLQLRLRAATANSGGKAAQGATATATLPEPTNIAATSAAEAQRTGGVRNLLEWIAEHVDLSQPEVLDVGFEVPVGGRAVHMQRIVQWPLGGASGRTLHFSVPIERQDEMHALLKATRAQGFIGPNTAQRLAEEWELVPGELATSSRSGRAEPAVLLAHAEGKEGMLVATWPTKTALEAFHAMHGASGGVPQVGDRVEVEYQGEWFPGVLDSIDPTGKASVQCDVDAPGTLTIAPFNHVRRILPDAPPVADEEEVEQDQANSQDAQVTSVESSVADAQGAAVDGDLPE